MEYTNAEMEAMLAGLRKHLDRTDLIGYAAARNTRTLQNELTEYFDKRKELVVKYGEQDLDENGNLTGTVSLPFGSEKFPEFLEEINQFAAIEHEPSLFKLKFGEAIGQLTGSELLEIEWMFED